MMTLPTFASTLARAWVRVYTGGMPLDLGEARRAEVDGDLWECQQESRRQPETSAHVAVEILLRTFMGIPDDIGWRVDASRERRHDISLRRPSMATSPGRLRWMGLGAIVGGALIIGVRLVDIFFDHPGRVQSPSGNSLQFSGGAGTVIVSLLTLLSALSTLGVIGLKMQQRREHDGRGATGLLLLLAGHVTATVALALQAFGVAFSLTAPPLWLVVNLLIIPAYALLIPVGLLLVGVRLPNPWRYLAVLAGAYLLVQPWLGGALRASIGSAASLFGSEAGSLVLGLGAATIGAALWSSTRGTFSQTSQAAF
jgi:hypothetical protein